MIEKLLHTPEGVRDVYNIERKKKSSLEQSLYRVLQLYGYQDIETPTFEFFDVFNSDTGTVSSREMYKFFDRNNNTLVLRPDMTPSIARSVAKYYSDCKLPLRLSCKGNVFMNRQSYQGKLSEVTEIGAELINDNSAHADAESIMMMIDCFLSAGLTDFRIDIGQTDFYRGVMDALDVSKEVKQQIHEYVENKNSLGMEILVSELDIKPCYHTILTEYNELYGDVNMLEKAKSLTVNPRCIKAVERLQEIYAILCEYGYEKYVSFDLGMVNHFDYYTGVIFRGYTYGTGDAIGKGGRYDNLLAQFGKDAPAIGFSIPVDHLLLAMERQELHISTKQFDYYVLLSEEKEMKEAFSLVSDLRKCGMKTEFFMKKTDCTVEEYKAFVKEQGCFVLIYMKDGQVEIHNLMNDTVTSKSVEVFRKEL